MLLPDDATWSNPELPVMSLFRPIHVMPRKSGGVFGNFTSLDRLGSRDRLAGSVRDVVGQWLARKRARGGKVAFPDKWPSRSTVDFSPNRYLREIGGIGPEKRASPGTGRRSCGY
jgi:hypothetical protein